jgi:hypothetical protein
MEGEEKQGGRERGKEEDCLIEKQCFNTKKWLCNGSNSQHSQRTRERASYQWKRSSQGLFIPHTTDFCHPQFIHMKESP